MKSILVHGLDPEVEKSIRGDFLSSRLIRKRLIEVLNEKIDTNRKTLRSPDGYQDPSWPYKQADGVGYERALFEVISLLKD